MQRFASLLHHMYKRREESPSPHRPDTPTFEQKRVVRKQEAILTQVRYPNAFVGIASLRRNFVQQHIKISLSRAFLEMSQVRVFA